MTPTSIVRSVSSLILIWLLLFVPAGTLDWAQAWVFVAIYLGGSIAIGLWLMAADPALLAERMKSPLRQGQTGRDRTIILVIVVALAAWMVLMGLDARRYGWTHMPAWLETLGAVLIVAAFIGWVLVLRANSFASTAIALQPDRGQRVISHGPYAIVRHPMYSWVLVFLPGVALLLGSGWGLVTSLVFAPLLVMRTLGEEAMLLDGLPGYRDYAARVRYRLVPGVW